VVKREPIFLKEKGGKRENHLCTSIYLHACAIASNIWSAVSCSTYKILHCCSTPPTREHVPLANPHGGLPVANPHGGLPVSGLGGLYLFLGGRMTGFLVLPSPIVFVVFPLLLFSPEISEKSFGFITFRKT
jgi:hypothetical protein